MIQVQGLSKRFGNTRVIADLSLSCQRGETVLIKGESGCGKTTLLRIIAGLETADSGKVLLGGIDCREARPDQRQISFDFQASALWPNMSVEDNLRFAMETRDESRVQELLSMAQLSHLAKRFPAEISGGQAKRVALVRALAPRKPILLLDEPVTHLGKELRSQMIQLIQHEAAAMDAAVLVVTHSDEETNLLGGRVVEMPNLSEALEPDGFGHSARRR